ncbi:hypothetical protein SAMN05421593_0550 [Chryseobacterium culicis]|jgi:hypothetical protein|uniref:Uncharacterized protein n=1 Tax=Chryseobacterium culicis TaxID=680127 RepID=A0A1H6GWV0_CHRCI|nr:hypothetical protein SAMN05421593_0550 [Chryseobacterium culicis]
MIYLNYILLFKIWFNAVQYGFNVQKSNRAVLKNNSIQS